VQVHEVERYATLQISLDTVHRHLLADVENAAETDSRLGDCLVHSLVLGDAFSEIRLGLFSRHACVVGVTGRCFEGDVCGDDRGVVAERLEIEELQSGLLRDAMADLFSTRGLGLFVHYRCDMIRFDVT
jgi:hypothetical protein